MSKVVQLPAKFVEPKTSARGERGRPGPNSLRELDANPEFRQGRASIREAVARDLDRTGSQREADTQFRTAKAILDGRA